MRSSSRYVIAVPLLALCLASTARADAEDVAWEGGLSLEWTDGTPGTQTNWVGAVLPGTADTALFTATGIAADKTVTVASPVTVAGIKTAGIAGDLTISGSPLSLSYVEGAGANKKDLTIANDIVLAADATIYRRDNTEHFLTIQGSISGDHALTVTNDSTSNWRAIRLYGANSYTGGTSAKGRIDYKAGAFGSGAIIFHGTADLAPVGGAILSNDLNTSGGLPILNNGTVATGVISGSGPLRVNTATLAGTNTFSGQLQINGGYTVTLSGSLAMANIHLGRDTGAQAILRGSGTITCNLGDPSNPASAANDRIILDWGKDMPSENGTSVDTSLLLADGLTLALNINGSLNPALEYPLVIWETMFNATYGVLEQSGKILGEFTVTGLPPGWYLHYHGTAANPNGVVLAYGAPVPVGDDGTGLKAEYFDNRSFEGVPVVEALESPYYNWGTAKPYPAITSADNFSVRWSGKIRAMATGSHSFFVDHDDECRVLIDGQVLIRDSGWGVAMCTVDLVDDQLVDIVVELVEEGGSARCLLEWGSATMARQPIQLTQLYPVEIDHKGSGTGLVAKYFDNRHLAGAPVIERTEGPVNFDWGSGSPDSQLIPVDDFSIEWSGQLETPYDDDYTLKIEVDDGIIVWLDGKIVINKWKEGQPFTVSHTFTGEAGMKYPIRVAYYEHTGYAKIRMRWECTAFGLREIPQDRLFATQAFKVVLPESSITSPAFIEGAVPDDQHEAIEVSAGGTSYDAIRLAKNTFFVDVALVPSATPTPVSIGMAGDTPTTGDIAWTPTLLDGGDTVVIRKGESLLIQATPDDQLTVLLECGAYSDPVTVPTSGLAPVQFSQAGNYIVQDTFGHQRNVLAISVGYENPVACEVGFTRTLGVPVAPNGDHVWIGTGDSSELWVASDGYDEVEQDLNTRLRAERPSSPVMLARLIDEDGPILWYKRVDEFTLETTAADFTLVVHNQGFGTARYTMRPYVPGVRIDYNMFASKSTFAGGATTLQVFTDDVSDTGWELVDNPATGEIVGVYHLEIEVPENENQYCFSHQPMQTNDYWVEIGDENNNNGAVAGIKLHEQIYVVPEQNDENIHPLPCMLPQEEEFFIPGKRVTIVEEFNPNGANAAYQLDIVEQIWEHDGAGGENGDHCGHWSDDGDENLFTTDDREELVGDYQCWCDRCRKEWIQNLKDSGELAKDANVTPEQCPNDDGTAPPHICDTCGVTCAAHDPQQGEEYELLWLEKMIPRWPDVDLFDPVNDGEKRKIEVYTGIQRMAYSIFVTDTNGEISHLCDPPPFQVNQLEIDGWTGEGDMSTMDPIPKLMMPWYHAMRSEDRQGSIDGVPVQITLKGPVNRKVRVHVPWEYADLIRIGPANQPTISFDADGDGPVLPGMEVMILDLEEVAPDRYSTMIYVYPIAKFGENNEVPSPAMIHVQMLEKRVELQGTEVVTTEPWVTGDIEMFGFANLRLHLSDSNDDDGLELVDEHQSVNVPAPPADILFVPVDVAGEAEVDFYVDLDLMGAEVGSDYWEYGNYEWSPGRFRWRLLEKDDPDLGNWSDDAGNPKAEGDFSEADVVTLTWEEPMGERKGKSIYTLEAWFDRNDNEEPDKGEVKRHLRIVPYYADVINPIDFNGNGEVDDFATTANGLTGNAFGYVPATPDTCVIPCRLALVPDTAETRAFFVDKMTAELEAVTNAGFTSTLAWDHAKAGAPAVGQFTYNATTKIWECTATFIGLPPIPANSWGRVPKGLRDLLYGARNATVTIALSDSCGSDDVRTVPYEVYYGDSLVIAGERMAETTKNYADHIQALVAAGGVRREIFEKMNCSTETFSFVNDTKAEENFSMRSDMVAIMKNMGDGEAYDFYYVAAGFARAGTTVWDPATSSWTEGAHWYNTNRATADKGYKTGNFTSKATSNPHDAIMNALPFRGECAGALEYCLYRSAANAIGTARFNAIHPAQVTIGYWKGTAHTVHMAGVADSATRVPGDYVYLRNHNYGDDIDGDGDMDPRAGLWRGENCVYHGSETDAAGGVTDKYGGLGSGFTDISGADLIDELFDAYNDMVLNEEEYVDNDGDGNYDDLNGDGTVDANDMQQVIPDAVEAGFVIPIADKAARVRWTTHKRVVTGD